MPMPAIDASLHRLMSAKRSWGWLSMVAMTQTGSGTAKSETNSRSVRSPHESISSVTMPRMNGSIAAIVRGLNAFATRLRKRVCSGGSVVSIVDTRG